MQKQLAIPNSVFCLLLLLLVTTTRTTRTTSKLATTMLLRVLKLEAVLLDVPLLATIMTRQLGAFDIILETHVAKFHGHRPLRPIMRVCTRFPLLATIPRPVVLLVTTMRPLLVSTTSTTTSTPRQQTTFSTFSKQNGVFKTVRAV